jgi:hypothetical protein
MTMDIRTLIGFQDELEKISAVIPMISHYEVTLDENGKATGLSDVVEHLAGRPGGLKTVRVKADEELEKRSGWKTTAGVAAAGGALGAAIGADSDKKHKGRNALIGGAGGALAAGGLAHGAQAAVKHLKDHFKLVQVKNRAGKSIGSVIKRKTRGERTDKVVTEVGGPKSSKVIDVNFKGAPPAKSETPKKPADVIDIFTKEKRSEILRRLFST